MKRKRAHKCITDRAHLHHRDPEAPIPAWIADVVHRCPSGALQYHRTDGAFDEEPEVSTHVSLHAGGVLHLRGDLEVVTAHGSRQETRVMLCGCGRTGNAPYCDHSGVCGEHG
ncbi:CDGSH iron-sulfur domain-containing protein [Streptomyces sp. NPDC047515]|uniref:CDGSH iron-sulfur domain-containing protein n=1 Tax=Streptomyces sp. NPDC047515 TaxID=3155380 RepID=UPI0033CDD3E4